MKNLVLIFLLLLSNPIFLPTTVQACDGSSLTFLAATPAAGGTYDISLQYCIAGGILGLTKGADDNTGTVVFGFYGTGLSINSYPANITSDTTGCSMTAFPFTNSLGAPLGVGYVSPGCNYACVTSTAGCGTPHSECKTIIFNTNMIPDSIRLFGVEGNGNPLAGCYPNSDMLVDFTTLLAVEWSDIYAEVEGSQVTLNWQLPEPTEISLFSIQRKGTSETWESLDSFSPEYQETRFIWSHHGTSGTWLYRVQATEPDGSVSYSPVAELRISPDLPMTVFPNPASESISMERSWVPGDRVRIFSVHGQIMEDLTVSDPTAKIRVALDGWPKGIYTIMISSQSGHSSMTVSVGN